MSEVKRWNVESDEQDGPCSLWNVESAEGEFVKYEDYAALKEQFDFKQNLSEQVVELQKQRDVLAAENAALKVISNDRRSFIMNGVQLGYIKVPTVETDPALETIRIAVSPQEPTSATDAYLNTLRESFVDEAIHALAASGAQSFGDCMVALNQLRAGEPS